MGAAYHRRLQGLGLLGALPGVATAVGVCLLPGLSPWVKAAALGGALLVPAWVVLRLGEQAQRPLQTLANLLAALREGDFSFRARRGEGGDALGTVYAELNTLAELLQQQRLKALEATALLREVMGEIEVAIFAFDGEDCLRLVNRAGSDLLGLPMARLQGEGAAALGLEVALRSSATGLLDLSLPGRTGRFEVRRTTFRQGGHPMQLLVLSDLTHTLREEERRTWQRLIRVLGHEINNSLAPIQSLAESLVRILEAQGEDWMEDARQGLGIIGGRAQGLGRFMASYTRLARLPEPCLRPLELGTLVRRVAQLERQVSVRVTAGPEGRVSGDEDQLSQALINLLKNAAEAAAAGTGEGEGEGEVEVGWVIRAREVEVWIRDTGPGLPEGGNLFVPFFTTKPGGSGIGLVLSRQIAEGHGGSLVLQNRTDRPGAEARLRLPLDRALVR